MDTMIQKIHELSRECFNRQQEVLVTIHVEAQIYVRAVQNIAGPKRNTVSPSPPLEANSEHILTLSS
jgi:hypothetical protein